MERRIVLASASPRRRDLLRARGIPFEVVAAAVDEDVSAARPGASPAELAVGLALRKALHAARRLCGALFVLGADTVVVAPGGQLLGKPRDAEEAAAMVRLIAGREHRVVTGIAWLALESGRARAAAVESAVRVWALGERDIEEYVASGLWEGKAGAYGAQDGAIVASVAGSWENVVGLPVDEALALLSDLDPAQTWAGTP